MGKEIQNANIDNGRSFDWGRTSGDYAKYRDIYPEEFYRKLLDMDIGTKGQKILDIGTGTGVLPRNLYCHGAGFTGIDISENQIAQAVMLAERQNMKIVFQCVSAEETAFPAQSFDVVTACQCFLYFDHARLAGRLHKMLKRDGRFAIMYMAWLPFEDAIAERSEELILKYNPSWTGCRETRRTLGVPKAYEDFFTLEKQELFDLKVPFDREHRKLLQQETAPEEFEIQHYAAITVLRKKEL